VQHTKLFGATCLTSGSHGKAYAGWALPGATCLRVMGLDGVRVLDAAVLRGVSTRLEDTLSWIFPTQSRRISDEHISTDEDQSSGSEEREIKLLKRVEKTLSEGVG
jgi:hypothetical protein